MRGMGYSMLPTCLTVFGSCIFRIIWVFLIFPKMGSFHSLILVYPVSWLLTGSLVLSTYGILMHRLRRKMEQEVSMDREASD